MADHMLQTVKLLTVLTCAAKVLHKTTSSFPAKECYKMVCEGNPEDEMVYEGNPKHKHPWQRGRKGSLCRPKLISIQPAELLKQSILGPDGKRYAMCDGRCFCAQDDNNGHWHGYRVGWREVPEKLRRDWKHNGTVKMKDIKKYWIDHGL